MPGTLAVEERPHLASFESADGGRNGTSEANGVAERLAEGEALSG